MKAYKGFNRNTDGTLSCRGFVYEIGRTYKHEGPVEVCKSGFHACHELHQTWPFYPNDGENAFYEVECGGEIVESDDGEGKFACSEITILREVDMVGIERFDDACTFNDGFAVIKRSDKYNHINLDGKLLSETWWGYAFNFQEGFAAVYDCKSGKWNHIGTDGKLLSDECWDDAGSFREGYARVCKRNKCNHIGADGKLLSDVWWDNAGNFNEGFSCVTKNGKMNHIDHSGKLLSEEWWVCADNFFDGVSIVELGNHKKNYLKPDGTLLSDVWFDYADSFYDGHAFVLLDDTEYLIDREGEMKAVNIFNFYGN